MFLFSLITIKLNYQKLSYCRSNHRKLRLLKLQSLGVKLLRVQHYKDRINLKIRKIID